MNLREITSTAQGTDSALTPVFMASAAKSPHHNEAGLGFVVFFCGERRDYGRKDPQKFVATYHHDRFGGHIIDCGRDPIRDLRPAKKYAAL